MLEAGPPLPAGLRNLFYCGGEQPSQVWTIDKTAFGAVAGLAERPVAIGYALHCLGIPHTSRARTRADRHRRRRHLAKVIPRKRCARLFLVECDGVGGKAGLGMSPSA